jgi:transposase-like protein
MVRKYIKKRSKPEFPEEDTEKAVKAVMSTEMKLREAAAVFGLNPSALYYRIQKAKKNQEVVNVEPKPQFSSKYMFRQIFSTEEEEMLCSYIITCSKLDYGLAYKQIRKLVFDFAKI